MEWRTPGEVIRDHLESEEKLLWSGRPAQGIRLRPHDVFLIPFGLLWCGFAIFWEVMALGILGPNGGGNGPPEVMGIIFPLFGLPFVLVGLYLIFGRFLVDAGQRARTFYGVTNERIIIVSGLLSRQVKSLSLRTLSDLSMSEKRDGTGTITFGPTNPLMPFLAGMSWPGAGFQAAPSFDSVPDVAEVYRVIREAQKA